MKSKPSNIYEAEGAEFDQETKRLKDFDLPNSVSIGLIGEIPSHTRFLDVGSGPSTALSQYIRKQGGIYTALDKNPSFLDLQKQGGASTVQGDIRNMPFGDNSFDLTHVRFVIAHLGADKHKAIQEVVRVTADGGRAIFIDFDWTVAHGSETFNEFKELITSGATLFDAGFGSRLEEVVRSSIEPTAVSVSAKRHTPEKMMDYQQVLRLREAGNADFNAQDKQEELEQWDSLLDSLQAEANQDNPPGFYFPDLVSVTVSKQ
jgi:ubiquinone/menaquinone biosynthesis C-methylase UbiE